MSCLGTLLHILEAKKEVKSYKDDSINICPNQKETPAKQDFRVWEEEEWRTWILRQGKARAQNSGNQIRFFSLSPSLLGFPWRMNKPLCFKLQFEEATQFLRDTQEFLLFNFGFPLGRFFFFFGVVLGDVFFLVLSLSPRRQYAATLSLSLSLQLGVMGLSFFLFSAKTKQGPSF